MTPRCGRPLRRYEAVWGALLDDPVCGRPAGHSGQCRSVQALRRKYADSAARMTAARRAGLAWGRSRAALLAVLLLAAAGCASVSSSSLPPAAAPSPSSPLSPAAAGTGQAAIPGGLGTVADEGRVTYTVTLRPGQCHALDNGRLPDPACTPGSLDPAVTQADIRATICTAGWTVRVRPPAADTDRAKYQVAYPAYGIPAGTVSELDHLVPLELGGSNAITNLWPEVGPVPNAKDKVENDLRADVCAGELTLAQAQLAIAADWETAP